MRAVGSFIDSIPGLGWLNLGQTMEQFSHTIGAQVHLEIEGDHLDAFNDNFWRKKNVIGFPKVLVKDTAVIPWEFF